MANSGCDAEVAEWGRLDDERNMGTHTREMSFELQVISVRMNEIDAKVKHTNDKLHEVAADVRSGSWKSTATLIVAILTFIVAVMALFL